MAARVAKLPPMQSLIQRVTGASVSVAGETVADIDHGLVALVAVMKGDEESNVKRMAERLLAYRVFGASAGQPSSAQEAGASSDRMERNVVDVGGQLLMIPQFTLGADVKKGTRPSFHPLADPQHAEAMFELLCARLEQSLPIGRGVFGAHMSVSLVNDGPVTLLLQA